MRSLAALNAPLLASMLVAVVFAAWGFRAALARDRRVRVSILAACVVLIVQSAIFARFTVDDAFITYRYSRNFAAGLGPVFQPGEPVEGYTSFMQMALLAIARRAGIEIEFASKALGILSSLAALAGVSVLAIRLGAGGRAAKIAPILLSLSPLNAAWTFAGLEAPMFAAVLCWAACLLVTEARDTRSPPWSGLLFGILVLVRPEGVLFAGIALATQLFSRAPGGDRTKRLVLWCLAFAAIAVPYWLWRWHYYGAFFPNTFYAKTSLGVGRVIHGVASVSDFFAESGLHQLLLVLIAAGALRAAGAGFHFVFASIVLFLGYVVAVGGDIQFLRFYVHILPLWTVCVAIGLDRVLRLASRRQPAPSPARAWGVALALALPWTALAYHENASALAPEPHNQTGVATVVDVSNHIQRANAPLGDWLHLHAPKGVLVAVTDIGVIAYRSDLSMMDLYGLTDRRIARLLHARGGGEAIASELRSRSPEFLVLYGSSSGASLGFLEQDRAWFNAEYRPHSFWPDSPYDKGLVLLVRKDVQVAPVSTPGLALHSI